MFDLTDMIFLCQSRDDVTYVIKLCLFPTQIVVVHESAFYRGLLWLFFDQVAVVHDSAY